MLRETNIKATIIKFYKVKRINTFALFLLKYYLNKDKVKAKLMKCS